MFKIKGGAVSVHDTSYGGYPYKATVYILITDAVAFKKLKGNLGNLVVDVNNEVYRRSGNLVPAYNPSIDSQGSKRFKNGVKTMEFVYFFKDHSLAETLGIELLKLKNGEVLPKYSSWSVIKFTE